MCLIIKAVFSQVSHWPTFIVVLILPIHEVRAGARLAMSVAHPKARDQELLKAGFLLDDAVIGRLKSLEVKQVFVEFPGLDDLDQYLGASVSPERQEVFDQVKQSIGENEKSTRPVVRYAGYVQATRGLVKTLLSSPKNAVFLDLLHKADDEVEHATAVAHLALVLGLKLDSYLIRERPRLTPALAKDITALGVAGMMHDIGKTRLPPEIRNLHILSRPDDAMAQRTYPSHVQLGYDMIHGEVDSTIAATVLHHHQRWDGTGFPVLQRGDQGQIKFVGSQIHIFARIIAAADLFERIASQLPGQRMANYHVLELLRNNHVGALDPEVLNVMPQVIPPFSPGRRVTLSDGTVAVVTGFFPFTPYRPTVKRIDVKTMVVSDETIDLRTSDLSITELESAPVTPGVATDPTPTLAAA